MTNDKSLTVLDMLIDVTSVDFENWQIILNEVSLWADREKIEVSREIINENLSKAINKGLIQAYLYSSKDSQFFLSPFDQTNIESLYFLATKAGKERLN
jgi:hypothetical protein